MDKESAARAAYLASMERFKAQVTGASSDLPPWDRRRRGEAATDPTSGTEVQRSSAGVPAEAGHTETGTQTDVGARFETGARREANASAPPSSPATRPWAARAAGVFGAPARATSAGIGPDARSEDDELLAGLNPEQREAVVHEGGPVLVVAGAGSGKTRVLTARIAHLIRTGRATPGQILAITFTNKAAKEMRERLEAMLGPAAHSMWISTFHSACVRILRAEHEAVGLRSSFTIYDAQDSQRLMAMVCRENSIDVRSNPPKVLSRKVSDMKNALVSPEAAASQADDADSQVVAKAYALYQERLTEAHAVDFDDIIMKTVLLFRSSPQVADHYRRRFRHVLVDEYQDTNEAQYELVRLLAGTEADANHGELMVVGDADQSIYAFRGATIRNIQDFDSDFPNARTILLEQNYRSTQTILDAANAIISHNAGRRPKRLWTNEGAGNPIVGYVADSEADEAAFVVEEIDSLRESDGVRYGDVAVFYRTNAQSRAVEDMFVRSGIPYRVIGGTRFYERREIKDVLAYLHAAVNPDDTVSIRRILNVPKRGLGEKAQQLVVDHAARWGISFGAALSDVAHPGDRGDILGLQARARSAIVSFVELLDRTRKMVDDGAAIPDVVGEVLDGSGYLDMLRDSKDPQDESRVENVAELYSVAGEFAAANPDAGLADWLDQISLVSDSDQLADADGEGEGDVTLMTVHTAKGLEFPVVFATGMEDGTFPHMRSLVNEQELEEERRLAYVAVTRARKRLYITRAAVRSAWGAQQEFPASRFIAEIPEALIDWRREESSMETLRGWGSQGGRYGGGSGYNDSYGTRGYSSNRGYGNGGYGSDRGYGSNRGSRYRDDWDDAPVLGSGTGVKAAFVPGKLGADTAPAPKMSSAVQDAAPVTVDFTVGDRVKHKSFGVGRVVSFEGTGRNLTAVVAFRSGQTKRLALRFAPLSKLD